MASFTVNALQVNFESVLSMDNAGMVKMFKSLEESGLRVFLGASGSVLEGALTEFFANATVITETIVSTVAKRKIVIMKDVNSEMSPNKKKDMKVEYRLLHDIVAKSLSVKAGSFDVATTEKFEMMVAISAGLKIQQILSLEHRAQADEKPTQDGDTIRAKLVKDKPAQRLYTGAKLVKDKPAQRSYLRWLRSNKLRLFNQAD
ncbi:hypothetical protein F511_38899 [Dorcoceras hygrometricum]|uniref:Uncharacterized protein n=1 Tax=Dorcoceras hygrometricum TaxID=472368 RepID=A0A2Z7CXC6_9LAMI|nr:hypothetical protein F511_38899 [Dorcoceras hygrometricum]